MILGVIKIASDLMFTIIGKFIQPLMAWVLKQSMAFAVGFNRSCKDLSNAATNTKCNGVQSEAVIKQVAQGATAKTLLTLSFLMALPLLLAAVISALIKQSLPELGKTLLRLPFVWIISTVAIVILMVAVGFRDGVVVFIIDQTHLFKNLDNFMNVDGYGGSGMLAMTTTGQGIGQLLAMLAAMFGGLLLFIVFMVGNIVILTSVLFVPLTTVGLIWGGTAKWFKRLAELSFAFIIGKVVVVAILALTFELLAENR